MYHHLRLRPSVIDEVEVDHFLNFEDLNSETSDNIGKERRHILTHRHRSHLAHGGSDRSPQSESWVTEGKSATNDFLEHCLASLEVLVLLITLELRAELCDLRTRE